MSAGVFLSCAAGLRTHYSVRRPGGAALLTADGTDDHDLIKLEGTPVGYQLAIQNLDKAL